jgi:hypothetical protein
MRIRFFCAVVLVQKDRNKVYAYFSGYACTEVGKPGRTARCSLSTKALFSLGKKFLIVTSNILWDVGRGV